MKATHYNAVDLGFNAKSMSNGATQVVQVLQEAGYEAYLVGGCVRDILIGIEPKDFDVATDARPEEVTQLFRRSRQIGRRFKIVHVRMGREVIEVTTFRAAPKKTSKSWLGKKINKMRGTKHVFDDNAFGRLQDDVLRRDFTINALYYDPIGEEIIDYLGAVEDIKNKKLALIGDAKVRFAEDPVRMLRLLRFKAKLGFQVDSSMNQQIEDNAHLLHDIPPARLFDEACKFFHSGYAIEGWEELVDSPFLEILFESTDIQLNSSDSEKVEKFILYALKNTDCRVKADKPVIPAFFFSVILWHAYQQRVSTLPEQQQRRNDCLYQCAEKLFNKQSQRIALPRRITAQIMDIWYLQGQLERRKARSVPKIMAHKRFRAAYDFLLLREKIGEVDAELTDWWTRIQEATPVHIKDMIQQIQQHQPGKHKNYTKKNGYSQRKRSFNKKPRNQSSMKS